MARRGAQVRVAAVVPLLGFLLLGGWSAPAHGTAQAAATAATTLSLSEDVDAYVAGQMDRMHMPGLAVVVVVGGRVVHAEGYGVADGTGRPVTTETPFVLGSTSKQLTGLAVQQLVAQGEVRLEDPLAAYVPEFGDVEEDKARITVRDLLGHASGFTTGQGQAGFAVDDRPDDTLERRARWLAAQPLEHPPGSVLEYSNANYDLLGRVVEVAAGVPYGQYLAEHVLDPLGMTATTTTREDALADGVAAGWYRWFGVVSRPTPMPYPRSAVPSTFIVSSADDLTRVALAHLSGSGGLDYGVLEAAREPTSRYDEYIEYSSGWWVHPYWPVHPDGADLRDPATPTAWSHDGNTPSSSSYVAIVPETGFALVVLSNASYGVDGSDWAPFVDGLARTAVGSPVQPAPERDPWSILDNRHLLMVAVPVLQALTLALAARSRRPLLWVPAVVMAGIGLGLSFVYVPSVTDSTLWVTWRSGPDVGVMTALVCLLAVLLAVLLVGRLLGRTDAARGSAHGSPAGAGPAGARAD